MLSKGSQIYIVLSLYNKKRYIWKVYEICKEVIQIININETISMTGMI